MRSAVRKMGNSSAVIIPKPFLVEIGAKMGDDVDMQVENGRIIITPFNKHPRSLWAQDAKNIAKNGDDELVLAEFSNADDVELTW
jgi:antitoxin MazE